MNKYCLISINCYICVFSLVTTIVVVILKDIIQSGITLDDKYIENCYIDPNNSTNICNLDLVSDKDTNILLFIILLLSLLFYLCCISALFYECIQIKKIGIKIDIDKIKDKECSICYENFDNNKNIYITECEHLFHNKCLEEWKKYNNVCPCPICRLSDIL